MKNGQRKVSSCDSEEGSKDGRNGKQMRICREPDPGLKGDYLNIFLLLGLYFLQGIPLGIIDAVPLILVNKGVTYANQAVFSFVSWPFSIKLLWAPIVDSIFSARFGRRKSWFVPVQYALGMAMIAFSFVCDQILGDTESKSGVSFENIIFLTIVFFILIFLTATQDIAVDGWALTMLSKRNVEYAPSCNSVGQTIGVLCGSTLFLSLESHEFCNRWLRSTPSSTGIVSLGSFLLFWGIVFVVVTTFVMLFKREVNERCDFDEPHLGIVETYKMLGKIMSLRTVRTFAIMLLTLRIGFAAADAVTKLKLVEYGVKRQNLGLIKLPLIPLQLILPWVVTKFAIKKPMRVFYYTYPFRLFMGAMSCFLVWGATLAVDENNSIQNYYYAILIIFFALELLASYCTGITVWAFMARVSDPAIGGTYMTLLTTLSNLGGTWTTTAALYFVKYLSFEWCPENVYFCGVTSVVTSNQTTNFNETIANVTVNVTETIILQSVGDNGPYVDGFYVETCICILIGIMWMFSMRNSIKWLDSVPKSLWRCKK